MSDGNHEHNHGVYKHSHEHMHVEDEDRLTVVKRPHDHHLHTRFHHPHIPSDENQPYEIDLAAAKRMGFTT